MTSSEANFADLLNRFIKQSRLPKSAILEQAKKMFDEIDVISRATFYKWCSGEQAPRAWRSVLVIAGPLGIMKVEANALLTSANFSTIETLFQNYDGDPLDKLAEYWLSKKDVSEIPFNPLARDPYFVGREKILAKIIENANDGNIKVCCLSGMGGVGKSAIAIQFAHQYAHEFLGGVVWVKVGEHTTSYSIMEDIATAFGSDISQFQNEERLASFVRNLLNKKEALIIVDDLAPEIDISQFIPPQKSTFFLITTRIKNHPIRNGVRVSMVSVPPFNQEKEESFSLFQKILGEKVTSEKEELDEISKLLGYLPLAIKISAMWMNQGKFGRSSRDFLDRVKHASFRNDVLKDGTLDVEAVFKMSIDSFSHKEKLEPFFISLGGFSGEDFDALASASIYGIPFKTAEDMLYELVDLSLLDEVKRGRFSLHALIRDFCRKLDVEMKWRKEVAKYYLDIAKAKGEDIDALSLEFTNIISSFNVGLELGLEDDFVEAVRNAYLYLRHKGVYRDLSAYLYKALEIIEEKNNLVLKADFLTKLAHVTQRMGATEQAEAFYLKAIEISKQINDDKQLCAVMLGLGALSFRQGNNSNAEEYYKRGLELAEKQKNFDLHVAFLTNLGLWAAESGHHDLATKYYKEAYPIACSVPNKKRLITLLQNWGVLNRDRGNNGSAKKKFEEGLELAKEFGDPELQTRLLGNLGMIFLLEKDFDKAKSHFEYGLKLAKKIGHQHQISRQLANLGRLACKQGKVNDAFDLLNKALELAKLGGYSKDVDLITTEVNSLYEK